MEKAELKLFSQAVDPFGNASHATIHIYEINPNNKEQFETQLEDQVDTPPTDYCQNDNVNYNLIQSRKLDIERRSKWNSFDITKTVKLWMDNPKTLNCGILVEVEPLNKNDVHSIQHIKIKLSQNSLETVSDWLKHFEPLLVLKSREISQLSEPEQKRSSEVEKRSEEQSTSKASFSRKRRTVIQGSYGKSEKGRKLEAIRNTLCERYLMYVDFEHIRWADWVLAPKGFHAYTCIGSCPFPLAHHVNSTNHAIVQTIVNSLQPRIVGRSRCVPTELSSITLLYIDKDTETAVLKSYRDMVVQACGCR